MIEPGITLRNRYEILKTIGRGGMADVHINASPWAPLKPLRINLSAYLFITHYYFVNQHVHRRSS